MQTNHSSSPFKRTVSALLAVAMTIGPLAPGAYAATSLTNEPIAAKVAAKPNIIYTLDDSGSMSLSYIPDYVTSTNPVATPPGYCRHTNGQDRQACGTSFDRGYDEPMFAAEFNRLYYNPNITYMPPVNGAGKQASAAFPTGNPALSTSYVWRDSARTSGWTQVPSDPYLAPTTWFSPNLLAKVAVPVFCNNDWPTATYSGPAAALSVWSEVGDVNGEYLSTAGADCRINGTYYDALNSAPAITTADTSYNYPWQKSSGANDPKFFWRVASTRNIWCKTAGPGWPKSTTNLAGCGAYTCSNAGSGGVLTYSTVQTCNGSNNTGAPFTYTGTPAVANCNTNPLYQWTWTTGGCVGTIGVECSRCDRNVTIISRPATCSITGVSCGTTGGTSPTMPAPAITVSGNPACPNVTGSIPTGCSAGGTLIPPAPCNPLASATCNALYGGLGNGFNVAAIGSPSLLDDANGAGVTCRRNSRPTGAYTSTRFTYPEAAATTTYSYPVNDATCGIIPTSVPIPRYYYTAASVDFCDKQIVQSGAGADRVISANDQWRGFGTGTCKPKNDQTVYKYAKYGKMTRVGLVNDARPYNYLDQTEGLPGIPASRTYAEEMTNFSNWAAYYRTRILAAKTTSANAFDIVDSTFRAGFHSMNFIQPANVEAHWVNIDDFTSAQRTAWYAKLFSIAISPTKTPTLDAMIRIGEVIQQGAGAVSGLPAHTDPFPKVPPVTGNIVTCTANYHILFTDGETNQDTLPTTAGEIDGAVIPARVVNGVLPPDPGAAEPAKTIASLVTGSAWPTPYKDAASPTPNSLADYAMYYWMRDLRPTLLNNVPSHDGRSGNDVKWRKDPAWWQHVNFSALSFGSDGLLDSRQVTDKTDEIAAATAVWFTAPNYPRPPNSPNNPFTGTKPATAIDDLWHATVNGRGKFVYAETPVDVARGLGRIIAGIGNIPKARAAAAIPGQQLSTTLGNDFVYAATIEEGWSGNLIKVSVNTTTGAQIAGPPRWSARDKLDTLLATPPLGTSPLNDADNAWFASRRIVTKNVDTGSIVPFLFGSIGATNLSRLGTSNTLKQEKLVSYLRGGSTFGGQLLPRVTIEGDKLGQFRERSAKLGNISDSKPLIVGKPVGDFSDANDAGYTAFKALWATRAPRVYVGANDGMFHVFNGADDTGVNTGGTETFAYIPSALFNNSLDENNRPRGIHALALQDGGSPNFRHHFYVNGSARTSDIDANNCGTEQNAGTCAPAWKTIVVGSLGKGGNSYFAIDATDPNVTTEASAQTKILWEYSLPGGQYSYGRPIIAKTRADGWVVVIASGYNNIDGTLGYGDGKGHLIFLNAATGAFIRKLNTTAADIGTTADPSGLAQINGFTKDARNQLIEQIYGADLKGQLWRWDVRDTNAANWQAQTVLLANLTELGTGMRQPVTTAPQLEIDINNGVDRFVFIGTGQLLHPDDLFTPPLSTQRQTMYAIRDGTLEAPSTSGLPIAPRTALLSASGTAGVGGVAPNGWFSDLAVGQRIVNDVQADLNLVAYAGTTTQDDPCLTSLPAYIYARDFTTGESLVYSGGTVQPYYYSLEGAVGLELVALDSATGSFPELAIVFTSETNAQIRPVEIRPKSFGGGHRLSWRIVGE